MKIAHNLTGIIRSAVFVAGLAILPSVSKAADNIVVYNTGVDASGQALPGGSSDPHWTDTYTAGSAAVISELYPGWTPDSTSSAWIGVYDSGTYEPPTPYTFSETFSLAGLDPLTAQLSGTEWGDDYGTFELNGHLIDNFGENWTGNPWSVNDIGADSGWFNSGANTLTFTMNSSDNFYDGVRLEVAGTADPLGVPDANSSAYLLGIALAGIGAIRRAIKTDAR